jgi:hypothetical protein
MISVPVRALPAFAAAVNATMPLPSPLAPDVIVSHVSDDVAVHAQPVAIVTFVEPLPPADVIEALVGLMDDAHDPSWVTVKVWPAMVAVPVRDGPVLADALIVTEPLPDPVPTPTTASHATLLAAVHEHAGSATWTATVVVPPAVVIDCEVGWIAKLHGVAPGAGCVTTKVWPPIVSGAIRATPVFGATEKSTVPLPFPFEPDVIVTQGAPLVAVQAQPASVLTETLPVPPPAAIVALDGANWIPQAAPAWPTGAVVPFNETRPCRGDGLGFAATWNWTWPPPCPETGERLVIQLTSAEAVHEHSACVETAMLPAPPAASIVPGGVKATWHLTGVGPVEVNADEPHPATTSARAGPSRNRVRLGMFLADKPAGTRVATDSLIDLGSRQQHTGQP